MQRKGRQRKPQKPPPPGIGYFHTLPRQEQEALVEWARQSTREQRKVDEAHNAEVAAYVKSKAKISSEIDTTRTGGLTYTTLGMADGREVTMVRGVSEKIEFFGEL